MASRMSRKIQERSKADSVPFCRWKTTQPLGIFKVTSPRIQLEESRGHSGYICLESNYPTRMKPSWGQRLCFLFTTVWTEPGTGPDTWRVLDKYGLVDLTNKNGWVNGWMKEWIKTQLNVFVSLGNKIESMCPCLNHKFKGEWKHPKSTPADDSGK